MDASVAERGVSPGSVLTFFANTWEVRNPKVEVRKKSERPMQCKNLPLPLRRKAFGGRADPLLSRREGICLASRVEPFQGSGSTVLQPRVARSSQPWAGGHNPFGIGKALNK